MENKDDKKEIKIKTCTRCGQSKRVDRYFGRHANICSQCRYEVLKTVIQKQKNDNICREYEGPIHCLLASSLPETYKALKDLAVKEERTVEAQVRWIIKEHIRLKRALMADERDDRA